MDQIIKWITGVALAAIAGYFVQTQILTLNPAPQGTADATDNLAAAAPTATLPDHDTVSSGVQETSPQLPSWAVQIHAGRNGHFYLDAQVNGANIPFVVDTGASLVALSYEAAGRAGIRLKQSDFKHSASTANGTVPMALVTLESVRYKNINIRNVKAGVLPRGALGGANLLGNSFLSKLREYKVADGKLILLP